MSLGNRVEKLERAAGSGLCPCREARHIEIVHEDGRVTEGHGERGPCRLCGEPLPVWRIVIVRRAANDRL